MAVCVAHRDAPLLQLLPQRRGRHRSAGRCERKTGRLVSASMLRDAIDVGANLHQPLSCHPCDQGDKFLDVVVIVFFMKRVVVDDAYYRHPNRCQLLRCQFRAQRIEDSNLPGTNRYE